MTYLFFVYTFRRDALIVPLRADWVAFNKTTSTLFTAPEAFWLQDLVKKKKKKGKYVPSMQFNK